MPSYDLTGTIKVLMETQTFDSGFSKREFVVTTDEDRYPQDIKFECVKEKATQLDNLAAGQPVKVSFDIRGNEYKGRHFVNLNAWRVDPVEDSRSSADPGDNSDGPPLDQLDPPLPDDEDDNLPF